MNLRVGIPSIGMRAAQTIYQQYEAAAIQAARNNGAGLWYAGNDPTGFVFEDSVGTLPATGTDPIGLLLDRSYGTNNLGPEIPLNPDFNAATGWTIIQPTSGTTTISGGTLTINTVDGTFTSAAVSATNAVVGRTYKYTLTISSVTVGRVQIVIGGAASSAFDAPGTYTGFLTATTATGMWVQRFLAAAATVAIDQLSFKEVLGFSALQATAGNRPTLLQNVAGYFDSNFDAINDAWSIALPSAGTPAVVSFTDTGEITGYASATTSGFVIGTPTIGGKKVSLIVASASALPVGDLATIRTFAGLLRGSSF